MRVRDELKKLVDSTAKRVNPFPRKPADMEKNPKAVLISPVEEPGKSPS